MLRENISLRKKNTSDFRVMFLYPNIQQSAMPPYSIALFNALLKREGFNVSLFDATHYVDDTMENYENFQISLREFDWGESNVRFKTTSLFDDMALKVENYNPDVICISVVESTYALAKKMVEALPTKFKKIPILWGGVFATFAADKIFRDNIGDFVCRGEGEHAIVEFCKRACSGGNLYDIPSIWARSRIDGKIHKNAMGSILVDLDSLPFADYDVFEDQAFYRPMQGKMWRTVGVETQRGCPYSCTYCNSPNQSTLLKSENGNKFYRKKSMKRLSEEIDFYKKSYNIELIYMLTDTFLAVSNYEFDSMVEMYSDHLIPFWMNTRTETMSKHRAAGLESMNMLRMSFGIEHGNEEYRSKMLKRNGSNKKMIEAFEYTAGYNYTTTANCIVGMPEEDRGLIFDTINFCRQLPSHVEHTGAFIFSPFHGTPLRETAIQKGYLDADTICNVSDKKTSTLDQPQLRREEVEGLSKTFGLYQTLPKSEWKYIKVAEQESPEGHKMFDSLTKI